MLTLGIHDGHTATACLWQDGQVLACISEERLNRQKEWSGFPRQAIQECLAISNKQPQQVQAVGICSLFPQIGHHHYFHPPWYKKTYGLITKLLPQRVLQTPRNTTLLQKVGQALFRKRRQQLREQLQQLRLGHCQINFFEHHLLHAAAGYYTHNLSQEPVAIFTLDGSGDSVCATVNIGHNGQIQRLAATFNYNSICDFYTRVTQFLGLKPMAHEYKLMGLAAYSAPEDHAHLLDKFQQWFTICSRYPYSFRNTSGCWKWQFQKKLRQVCSQQRFDHIAGATQEFFENIVVAWVQQSLTNLGIRQVVLSGGGFMNVKLNYRILTLPELASLYVLPSCGDESNALGAALLAAHNNGYQPLEITPLQQVYWGASYEQSVASFLENLSDKDAFVIEHFPTAEPWVARKLAEGKIVGRFVGRMEWGARALGNRSILADPRHQEVVTRINRAIKRRDFWMPFAPSVLSSYQNRYLYSAKGFSSPFMTVAYPTHPQAKLEIPATLHPNDLSARAQIVSPEIHPRFAQLITEFARLTGVGAVLNTSFNLHGYPIVCSPQQAWATFVGSDLDVLQLENFVIEKK